MPGLVLLVSLLSGSLSQVLCIVRLLELTWRLEGFLMLRCFSCMSFGLVRGLFWRKLFQGIVDQVAQLQCPLFLLVQALTFGEHARTMGF